MLLKQNFLAPDSLIHILAYENYNFTGAYINTHQKLCPKITLNLVRRLNRDGEYCGGMMISMWGKL